MWHKVVLVGFLAIAPVPVLAQQFGDESAPYAVTCRPPQQLPGSRLMGPEVCKTNAVWAQYKKDGMTPAADGIHDVPSEKWRSINPQACRPATPGGSGISSMIQANFSMICE